MDPNERRPRYTCRVTGCGQQFPSLVTRMRHEKEIHDDRFYTCSVCPAGFQQFHELVNHMKILHPTPTASNPVETSQITEDDAPEENRSTKTNGDAFRPFHCTVCGKTFAREHNMNQHMKRHESKTLQCTHIECGKVFSRLYNLKRHHKIQHGGDSDNDVPTKQRRIENPRDHYSIRKTNENYSRKFQTTNTNYTVTFREMYVESLPEILETLGQIFESIISDITDGSSPEDRIQVRIRHPELDFPIMMPFKKQKDLTSDMILTEIERVLQSYEEFVLDDTIEIQLTHVSLPHGTGRTRKYVNLEKYLCDKKCVIRIVNKDKLCCALIVAKAKHEQPSNWDGIRKGRKIQKELALALHEEAGVPIVTCGIEEVKLFQQVMTDYQINIVSKEAGNSIIYSGPDAEKRIYLFYHGEHYDVITSIPTFFCKSYFCQQCKKGYDSHEKHKCVNVCGCCFKIHDENALDEWIHCDKCNRSFKGSVCFDNHERLTSKGNSTCKKFYTCKNCGKLINLKINNKHECGETYCKVCREYMMKDHRCYMKVAKKNKSRTHKKQPNKIPTTQRSTDNEQTSMNDVTKYIYFDFETIQDGGIHEPNLCIAHVVCENCCESDSCSSCGEREKIFYGPNTRTDFGKWLFSGENNGSICIAHNAKAFDSYFILKYLHENGIVPDVIFNGSKIMSLKVKACKMRFIDSINFMPMALSKLPTTFGLSELNKGYFPHMFSTTDNQEIVLQHLPEAKYYNPDDMKTEDRKKLYVWYEEHKHDEFNMKHELIKYCRSDVDILRRSCLSFRKMFMDITSDGIGDPGIDPFQPCVTVASACNLVYRTKYLRPETVAIIPPLGYRPEENQSIKALQWMSYISHIRNVRIRHARNDKEYRVGPYPVDGFYEKDGEKMVLEFEGCFFHGCIVCYPQDTVNPVNQLTMGELYQRTLRKRKYIESKGYTYEQQWECNWNKTVKNDDNIRKFVEDLEYVEQLSPRDAFYGGRTEGFTLYHTVDADEKIQYDDVTSLYPFINKYAKYPLGHPTVITERFEDLSSYEGLIKCKIVPPRELYIPVLLYRINGKLLFTLCHTCAVNKQAKCQHSDEDRSLTGTWVIDEVRKAVEKGYRILTTYEVWHFSEMAQYNLETKDGGLFSEYVDTFLAIKQQASGWPPECITEEDKLAYIEDYFVNEGVRLDGTRIAKNPGLRALAKIMMNSFWGRLAMRTNMTKTKYITDPQEYFDLLTSAAVDVRSARLVTSEMIEVQWCHTEDFIEPSAKTNVILAAFTTAHARLHLYNILDSLGERVLYTDTDSVIYTSRPGDYNPPSGNYLGDMVSELGPCPNSYITDFVTCGPKNYAYKLAPTKDAPSVTCCKVRGITLNYKNAVEINFETLSKMIQGLGPERVTVVDERKICRDRNSTNIVNKKQSKDYRIVFDKRVIVQDYRTLPYGY